MATHLETRANQYYQDVVVLLGCGYCGSTLVEASRSTGDLRCVMCAHDLDPDGRPIVPVPAPRRLARRLAQALAELAGPVSEGAD